MQSNNQHVPPEQDVVNDYVKPFWHARRNKRDVDDTAKLDTERLMVNFKLKGHRIVSQEHTTFSINGKTTPLNNPKKHWMYGKDESFEESLKNARGQPMRHLIKQLQDKQGKDPLVCPPEGLSLEIKQLDSLDDYVAHMSKRWFNPEEFLQIEHDPTLPEGEIQRMLVEHYLRLAPPLVAGHKVFKSLSRLVRMENGGLQEMYDVYIFILVVLFTWFDLEEAHWNNYRDALAKAKAARPRPETPSEASTTDSPPEVEAAQTEPADSSETSASDSPVKAEAGQTKPAKSPETKALQELREKYEESVSLREKIDEYINIVWLFKSDEVLRDIRSKCLLQSCMFERKTSDGISETIEKRVKEVISLERANEEKAQSTIRSGLKKKAKPQASAAPEASGLHSSEGESNGDGTFYAVIPERRDINRIKIEYLPKNLYDDWTVDELITSFFRSLAKRNIQLNEEKKVIRKRIHEKFFDSKPSLGGPFVADLKMSFSILYDKKVLSIFNLDANGIAQEDRIALSGTFDVVLTFENCVSDSPNEPALRYILKLGEGHISGKVAPATSFNLNLAYSLLRRNFNEKTTMAIHMALRKQLSTVEEDDASENPSSGASPDKSSEKSSFPIPLHTLQARIDEYERIAKSYKDSVAGYKKKIKDLEEKKAAELREEKAREEEMKKMDPDQRAARMKEIMEEEKRRGPEKEADFLLDRVARETHLLNESEKLSKAAEEAILLITTEIRKEAKKEIKEIKKRHEAATEIRHTQNPLPFLPARSDSSGELDSSGESDSSSESVSSGSDADIDYTGKRARDLPSQFYLKFPETAVIIPSDTTVVVKISDLDVGDHDMRVVSFTGFDLPGKKPRIRISRADAPVKQFVSDEGDYQPALAQNFTILSYGLNVLDVSGIDLNSSSFRENGETLAGFYPHQTKIIESVADTLSRNVDSTIILEASVGSGKTSVVLGVAKAMEQIVIRDQGDPNLRPFLIYTSDATNLLDNVFERAKRNNIMALAASRPSDDFSGKNIGVIFRGTKEGSDAQACIPHDQISTALGSCSLIVCHFRTLAFLVKMLEQVDHIGKALYTTRPFSIIIDEVKIQGGLNRESEHALGAILAYKPQNPTPMFKRAKNIAIFSASVNREGPIRYYTSEARGVRFLTNTSVLVPTELRQMSFDPRTRENNLLDLFQGYNDPQIIKKVKEDAFFRRFVSNAAVRHLIDAVKVRTRTKADEKIRELERETEEYISRMDKHYVTENSTIYNMFPCHKSIRDPSLGIQLFTNTTYVSTKEHRVKVDNVFSTYIMRVGSVPEEIISLCERIEIQCKLVFESRSYSAKDRELMSLISMLAGYVARTLDTTEAGLVRYYFNLGKNSLLSMDEFVVIVRSLPVSDRIVGEYSDFNAIRNQIGTLFSEIVRIRRYIDSFDSWIKDNPHELEINDPDGKKPSSLDISLFNRHVDDYFTIRECKYYAMVGTTKPVELMKRIYDAVVNRIRNVVHDFRRKHNELFCIAQKFSKDRRPDDREILARTLHSEFEQYAKACEQDHTKTLHINAGSSGRLNLIRVEEFDQWLFYMSESPNLDPSRKGIFTKIGSSSRIKRIWELRGTAPRVDESLMHTGELAVAATGDTRGTGGPKISSKRKHQVSDRRQLSIIDAWSKYEKEFLEPSLKTDKLGEYIDELNETCDLILKQHGFIHSQPIKMTREMINECVDGAESFYTVIGVFAPTRSTIGEIERGRYNRFFSGKDFAHGIDTPLEAVIFTQTVDDGSGEGASFSADDILQMSGRCGRPSKSTVSVVYMANSTYLKCINGDKADITNLLLRYKYYRLPKKTGTINGTMLPYSRYDEMEVASLHQTMTARTRGIY
jgi:Uncharacterized conserved protein